MTPQEVEALVHTKTGSPAAVRTITESSGDDAAYLSYSIDSQNQLTIWHTEVPPGMQHRGVGGRLVDRALDLTTDAGASLRLVCPFAKAYLERHPEIQERHSAAKEAIVERESLESGRTF